MPQPEALWRISRTRQVLLVLLLASTVAWLSPAGARAVGATSPATTLLPTTGPTATTPASSTGPVTVPVPAASSTSGGGLSSGEEIAIFVAAGLLIAGIARLIMRDARRHTPAGAAPDPDRPRGSVRPIEHRVKDSRAKAKRARRARRAGR